MPDNPVAPGQEPNTSAAPQGTASIDYQQLYASNGTGAPAAAVPAFNPADFETQLLAKMQTMVQAQPAAGAEPDWVDLMAKGKRNEGEAALIKKIESAIASRIQESAVNEATARNLAFQEVQFYTQAIKSDPANAPVLPLEPLITAAVEKQIAEKAHLIKTPADYVKVYKETVTAEMEKARQLVLAIRGQGNQQAQVRQAEVLASPFLVPQQVSQSREQPPQGEPQGESSAEYMARRSAASAKMRGLTPQGQ